MTARRRGAALAAAAAALVILAGCAGDGDQRREPLRVSGAFGDGTETTAADLGGEISESSMYIEFAGDGVVVNAAGLGNIQVTAPDETRTSFGFALGPAPVSPAGTMEGLTELTIRSGDDTTGVREGTWTAALAPDGSLTGSVVFGEGTRYGFVTPPDPAAAELADALLADQADR